MPNIIRGEYQVVHIMLNGERVLEIRVGYHMLANMRRQRIAGKIGVGVGVGGEYRKTFYDWSLIRLKGSFPILGRYDIYVLKIVTVESSGT